jgi:AraC family transcriptional regulator
VSSPEERAIRFLYERYSEPLSLADIANSAILSRFHFCRTFRDATGVTPGRFLSAIRIYQAKRLLLNTRMNVTEIAFAVGYNSLGSFSNHFTDSVGIAPGRFRRVSQTGGFKLPLERSSSSPQATVSGTVIFPQGYDCGRVYVGAFDTPIVQRQPAAAALIEAPSADVPCSFQLVGVPQGAWYLHAVAVADNTDPEPWTRRTLLVGEAGPVTVTADTVVISARIKLRTRRPTDLPILLALPDFEPPPADVTPAEAEFAAAQGMGSA